MSNIAKIQIIFPFNDITNFHQRTWKFKIVYDVTEHISMQANLALLKISQIENFGSIISLSSSSRTTRSRYNRSTKRFASFYRIFFFFYYPYFIFCIAGKKIDIQKNLIEKDGIRHLANTRHFTQIVCNGVDNNEEEVAARRKKKCRTR